MSPFLLAFWLDLFGFLIAAIILGFGYLWLQTQRRLPVPPAPAPPPATDPFSAQHITRTFVAALPNLTRELNLEVATSRQIEFFERTDQRSILGVSLGTNVARIRLPATYRYHLRLADPWRLEVQGSHLIVHAPVLRASLPPAIHTDEMEAHTERGWCRGASENLLRELHREVTPLISQWAGNDQHLGMVRETARLQAASSCAVGWKARPAGDRAASPPSACASVARRCLRPSPRAVCSSLPTERIRSPTKTSTPTTNMAITIEANYSKKIGLPGYSSHQYMLTLRAELSDLSQVGPESQRLHALLQASVDRELQQAGWLPLANGASGHAPTNGNGHHLANGNGNGNGHTDRWNCSPKQQALIVKIMVEKRRVTALSSTSPTVAGARP